MKRVYSLCLLVLLLALPGCQMQPVEDIESAPLFAPEAATLDQVKKGIVRAGLWRDWEITEVEPGHLVGTLLVRGKHSATVDIFHDTRAFSIRYNDSENLNYNGRSIHRNYHHWINFLKKDIQKIMRLIEVSEPSEPT